MRGMDRIAGRASAAVLVVCGMTGVAVADIWEDREALRQVLARAGDAGHMLPQETDPERYMQADLRRALEIAAEAPGDACVRAVQLALYLDAHRLPREGEHLDGYAELSAAPDAVWQMADGRDVLTLLRWSWDADLWKSVEGLDEVASYGAAFVTSVRDEADEGRDAWAEEAVALSLSAGWAADDVALAVARLEHQAGRAVDWIVSTEDWTRTRIVSADKAFEVDMKTAEFDWRLARVRLQQAVGEARFEDPQDGDTVVRKLAIETAFFDAKKAAQDRRADSIIEAMVVREENLRMALKDFARARVQQAALQRYTVPILGGHCADLARSRLQD